MTRQGEREPYRGLAHTCQSTVPPEPECPACVARSEDRADQARLEAEVRAVLTDRSRAFPDRLAEVRRLYGQEA